MIKVLKSNPIGFINNTQVCYFEFELFKSTSLPTKTYQLGLVTYLIDNGSTPFIEEEDYDLDLDFNPNPILLDKDSENLLDSCCLDLVKNSSLPTQSDISVMTSY